MAGYIDKWQAVANLMDAGLKDAHKAVNAIQFIPAADVRENGPILTKADEIRAMTDEELADKFRWLVCPFYWVSLPDETDRPADWSCKQNCHKCWLDWLKSPAEVEDA